MRRWRIHDTAYFGFAILVVFFLISCQSFEDQLTYNRAGRAHNERDFDKAIQLYRQLLAKDPDNKIPPDKAIIRYDLGVAYIDIGERTKAHEQIIQLEKMKRNDLAKELKKLLTLSDTL